MSKSDQPERSRLTRREWILILILAIGAVLFRVAASVFPERPPTNRGDTLPPGD